MFFAPVSPRCSSLKERLWNCGQLSAGLRVAHNPTATTATVVSGRGRAHHLSQRRKGAPVTLSFGGSTALR